MGEGGDGGDGGLRAELAGLALDFFFVQGEVVPIALQGLVGAPRLVSGAPRNDNDDVFFFFFFFFFFFWSEMYVGGKERSMGEGGDGGDGGLRAELAGLAVELGVGQVVVVPLALQQLVVPPRLDYGAPRHDDDDVRPRTLR
eukprot:TRINITY_DN14793_c0_g1_i1.p1 TRINITY_DN14793_c0_g1~~TRINITY_DN14793_c0_g1_i1.p1  ORF type:complete len:161 (+),score=56.59 TRINITY_DN14793_c0_g1_i1:59-484(+)